MNNKKTLFIVAAGLSIRFNGKPKHLAIINNITNIEHTLILAKPYYDNIYIILNEKANNDVIDSTKNIVDKYNANIVLIPSGKGDADAVYQALEKTSILDSNISVCWGDAWFINDNIFNIASRALSFTLESYIFNAMCAFEEDPYGWFNINGNKIDKCIFASDNIAIKPDVGIHDQCFFNIKINYFKNLYKKYKKYIEDKINTIEKDIIKNFIDIDLFKLSLNYEISWYKMINWSEKYIINTEEYIKSIVTIVEPTALSFNTHQDLEKIEHV